MTPQLQRRLEQLLERHHEVGLLLAEPDAANDSARFRTLSREYAHTQELADTFAASRKASRLSSRGSGASPSCTTTRLRARLAGAFLRVANGVLR